MGPASFCAATQTTVPPDRVAPQPMCSAFVACTPISRGAAEVIVMSAWCGRFITYRDSAKLAPARCSASGLPAKALSTCFFSFITKSSLKASLDKRPASTISSQNGLPSSRLTLLFLLRIRAKWCSATDRYEATPGMMIL